MELNQAAAIAEAGDVEVALGLLEDLGLELDRYHYLHATRADLLRRLDRVEDARVAYERALELVHSDAERRSSSGGSQSFRAETYTTRRGGNGR